MIRLLFALCMLVIATGCSTALDQGLREPAASPTPAEVQRQPSAFSGKRVRWGGSIINARNLERSTQIEVLARPLNAWGEPDPASPGRGRFIAELSGFRDPVDYPTGTRLTVVGTITRIETHDVGRFPYAYPVVVVEKERRWRNPPVRVIYPGPYPFPWYRPWPGNPGPWFGPWY